MPWPRRENALAPAMLAPHLLVPHGLAPHGLSAEPSLLPPDLVRQFPNYSDPVAIGPTTGHELEASDCLVSLFSHVQLSAFGQVESAEYTPPSGACAGPWESIKLVFRGSVRGVQYDRYGGLWLGGVPLLRTTTPEPTALA